MADFDDDKPEEPTAEWLGTFSDICLLLLTFFILLVSMSTIEIVKFRSVFGSMRDAFGGLPMPETTTGGQQGTEQAEQAQLMEFVRLRQEMLDAQRLAYNEIRSYITTKSMDSKVGAVFDQGIIVLTVPGDILFPRGSENPTPEAEPILRDLLTVFQEQREMNINIKGYTDNAPVPAGARYRDNWELSALRAVNVLRWLVDAGLPVVRLTATGMGDLDPLFPNDTPENMARNRRVEFRLERKVGGAN
jgi:chemotaxis protein MotB